MKILLIFLIFITGCAGPKFYEQTYICPSIINQKSFDYVLSRTEIIRSSSPAKDCASIGIEYHSLMTACANSVDGGYKMVLPLTIEEKNMGELINHEVCHILRNDHGGHEGWIEK